MTRSTGITVSAVIALIGSILTLLMGTLTLVIAMFAPIPESAEVPASPVFMKIMFTALSLMYLLPAIWGIATGIGLFRLRNWARISMIVFAVALVLMAGFSGLISVFMPLPPTANSHAPGSVIFGVRIFMVVLWLSLLGLGIWWLVFFTRPAVKAQFALQPVAATAGPPPLPGSIQTLASATQPPGPRRPLSITIIAWLLLVGCAFFPLNILIKAPLVLFTKLVTGWTAVGFFAIYTVISLFAGIGLLRLRPLARQAAIALYAFGLVSSLVFYFAPGGQARMLALMQRENSMFPWSKMLPAEQQFHLPTSFFFVFAAAGLAVATVPIYFLVTRSVAFKKAANDQSE